MATFKFKIRDNKGTATFGADQVKNWSDIEINFTRNKTYKGIVRKFTNTFEFVDAIKLRIIQLLDEYGPDAELFMRIYVGNDNKERSSFKLLGDGQEFKADFSSIEIDELTAKLNFTDSGYEEKLFSRDNTKVNFDATESFDGQAISDYTDYLKTCILHDRTIYLYSELNSSFQVTTNFYSLPEDFIIVGMNKTNVSDSDIKNVTSANKETDNLDIENYILLRSEENKPFKLNISGDIRASGTGLLPSEVDMYCTLIIYNEEYQEVSRTEKSITGWEFESAVLSVITLKTSINFNFDENINENYSVAVGFLLKNRTKDISLIIYQKTELFNDLEYNIESISYFPTTTTDFILPHELFSRLAEIYTGEQDSFYSTLFGRTELGYSSNGEWAYLGVANGKMIRGFDFTKNPLNTSLRDAFQSYNSILNIIAFIEFIGGKPRLRIEKNTHGYDTSSILNLGDEISNVSRKNNEDLLFTEINIGCKDYEYEEVNGLDSFNGTFTFSTPLKIKDKKYDQISKYRFDDYGIEFARRKQFSLSATEDTRYDKDIFIIDAKLGATGIEAVRAEDFTTVNNILEPQNVINLRLSSKRNLIRHGDIIRSGLIHKQADSLIYVKGANNAELQTQLTTESELLIEKDNVLIGDLYNPLFLAELIELECPFSNWQFDDINSNKNKMLKFVYKNYNLLGFIDDISYKINEEKANVTLLRANR